MKVISSEYLKSFVGIEQFDLEPFPAIAFIGRSNVGKSSLINSLLNRKKLVKTSSTPGKTQLLNYFLINQNVFFVDLPGYGFANVPVAVKEQWQGMITRFLKQCPNLRLIIQLVDIRHKPSKEDIKFQEMVRSSGLPCLVVANKVDKIKKNQVQKQLKGVQELLSLTRKPALHSALKKIGRTELWMEIDKALQSEDQGPGSSAL